MNYFLWPTDLIFPAVLVRLKSHLKVHRLSEPNPTFWWTNLTSFPVLLHSSSFLVLPILGSHSKPTLYHNAGIFCQCFTYSFFSVFSCALCFLSSPSCHCTSVPLLAFLSLHLFHGDAAKTLAVEIKVIKDLPWPPPVGQLNTSPPVVEELESPSQTAQPLPGQTSCDQHHHGGCWRSHLPVSSTHSYPQLPVPSIHPSLYQCGYALLFVSYCHILLSITMHTSCRLIK